MSKPVSLLLVFSLLMTPFYPVIAEAGRVPMYRAFNPNANYHFFTTSVGEFNNAVAHGYNDETTANGAPFYVPEAVDAGAIPIHRLYNPNNGRHYYTANTAEKDMLVSIGWIYEKDDGHVFPTQATGTVELFKLYNNDSGTHLYTADAAEKDAILAAFPGIWVINTSQGYAYATSLSTSTGSTDASGNVTLQSNAISSNVKVQITDSSGAPVSGANVEFISNGTDYLIIAQESSGLFLPNISSGSVSSLQPLSIAGDSSGVPNKSGFILTLAVVLTVIWLANVAWDAYGLYTSVQDLSSASFRFEDFGPLESTICTDYAGLVSLLAPFVDAGSLAFTVFSGPAGSAISAGKSIVADLGATFALKRATATAVFAGRNHATAYRIKESHIGVVTPIPTFYNTGETCSVGVSSNTYTSTDAPKTIRDNTTFSSFIDVSGSAGSITDINIGLDITHTGDQNLVLTLISPNGTRVLLSNHRGGYGYNYTATVFDAQASALITAGSAPFTGSYQPEGSLVNMNGRPADGRWMLEVTDDISGNVGTLNSWYMVITTDSTASVPTPPTGLSATAGNGQATLSWTAVPGATSYTLYRSGVAGGTGTLAGISAVIPNVTSPYINTGLTNGTISYYAITASNAVGASALSTEVSVTPTSGGGGSGGTTAGMVNFAAGTFTMGDNNYSNSPEHSVTLSSFWLDAKEVTQAQYQAVIGSNPSRFIGGTLPVEEVTWQEASDYCTAVGKRLPTEAEWEYASRNGGTAPVNAYATGSTTIPTCSTVNISGCVGQTSNVGSYAPSSSGLYDMAGNVEEWTGDWYSWNYYANGQVNPTGPTSGTRRVVRGGGWSGYDITLRASYRVRSSPTFRSFIVGFRCASN